MKYWPGTLCRCCIGFREAYWFYDVLSDLEAREVAFGSRVRITCLYQDIATWVIMYQGRIHTHTLTVFWKLLILNMLSSQICQTVILVCISPGELKITRWIQKCQGMTKPGVWARAHSSIPRKTWWSSLVVTGSKHNTMSISRSATSLLFRASRTSHRTICSARHFNPYVQPANPQVSKLSKTNLAPHPRFYSQASKPSKIYFFEDVWVLPLDHGHLSSTDVRPDKSTYFKTDSKPRTCRHERAIWAPNNRHNTWLCEHSDHLQTRLVSYYSWRVRG